MQTRRGSIHRIGVLIAVGALLQTGGVAAARDRVEQALGAPSGDASGQARVRLRSESDGRLVLTVHGLAPNQTFDVLVDDTKVGTLRTGGGGQGAVRFRTRPRGRDLLLGFDPRGTLITIRDAVGDDVLVGNIPAGSSSAHSGGVICCEPDDRGAECEDRTEAQCLARGGTVAAATSCMPNPCAEAPPAGQDIVCCVPDDGGAECEDRTPAECAAQGGIAVAATSCTPNPCAAVAPADPDIRCCLPDDGGAECEDRTPAQCAAQGGVNTGAGVCTPDACGGVVSPTPAGGDDRGGGGGGGYYGGGGQGGSGKGGSGRGGHDD